MGFMDELKEEYKKGQEDADRLFGKSDKQKETNVTTSEPEKKGLPIGKIVGAVVLGILGALILGLVGFLIGAAVGFFGGGLIWDMIKGAGPKMDTPDDIFDTK